MYKKIVYLKQRAVLSVNRQKSTTEITIPEEQLPKRTRYYAGMIDLNAIEKGADYSELPQSFVIFICTFDLFGKGHWRYTFENMCKEDNDILLGDSTTKIFFNTAGTKGSISEDTKNILIFQTSGRRSLIFFGTFICKIAFNFFLVACNIFFCFTNRLIYTG